ncbi:type II toxin-antitoxin system RnlB family antitoxin [Bacillus sp. BHET2]|uniref:type II toxin-antitoxin system RnlB family antitoxin n=1 Tax=Bacillus sp. BHET2 TaxID=2583818 RepID=UPI00148703D7|nr:type II toxin-antitoxin system RnlB family antitoxin [Bacillus sp. BHET2]
MKNYEIHKDYEVEGYPCVVFSTSFISPIEELEDIEGELNAQFQGKVLFDLLLSNGVSSNRFLEAEFNGNTFDYTSFKPLNVDVKLKIKVLEFYKKHVNYLENSILPRSYQYLLKQGKVF